MEIRSLASENTDTLFRAFDAAFGDYEMRLNMPQLERMLRRRGFDPSLSFGAFDHGRIVAFTFNGTGIHNGQPTAYDTGTGTLPAYRGQGLATEIFKHSMPHLRAAGITQYLLEVLQHNTGAVSIYRKLGFEVVRELNYFVQDNDKIKLSDRIPDRVTIRELDMKNPGDVSHFWDFVPSWQNDCASIERAAPDLIAVGAFEGERLAGYCVFEPASGDIAQLAVDKNKRRLGIGSMLLREAIGSNRFQSMKAIYSEAGCESVNGFMNARNIPLRGTQFEMKKKI